MALYTKPRDDNNRHDDYLSSVERFRTPSELGTSVHFNDELPLEKMRQYVQGMPWEVTYFNQYVDVNDNQKEPDVNNSIGNIQYIKISKLLIYVQTALDQTKITDLTISAIINAGFTPKTGDVFIATLIGGRIGMFTVEEVDINHYNLHATFSVNFKLTSMLESNSVMYNNLIAKVTKEYVYNKQYIQDKTSTILTRDEIAIKKDIEDAIEDLTTYYFKTFIDPDSRFLQLPSTGNIHYVDQELGKFCRKVFSVMDYPELTEMQTIDFTMDKDVRYTIWDVIIKRNPKLIRRTEPYLGFVPSPYPRSNLNSIEAKYLDVDYIINKTGSNHVPKGIENTVKKADLTLDKYSTLNAVKKDDTTNHIISKGIWDISIPGLDFKTTPSGEGITTPKEEDNNKDEENNENSTDQSGNNSNSDNGSTQPDTNASSSSTDTNNHKDSKTDQEPKKEDQPPLAFNLDFSNINPNHIKKQEVEPAQQPKKINRSYQSIKANKQYSLYRDAKKG